MRLVYAYRNNRRWRLGDAELTPRIKLEDVPCMLPFFFSSRRRHTRFDCDWSSDVCSSDLTSGAPGGGLDPRHVAVLYLEDLSPKHDLAYLADGLTETLIADLKRAGLDVVSKNGVARYRGTEIPPDSVARALSAGTLVRGALEESGGRYRVSVRLIEGSSGADFRRGSFEVPKGNLLSIRDSLAGDVADFLRQRLREEVRLREEEAGTRSPEAWALVQQAEPAPKGAGGLGSGNAPAAAARSTHAGSRLGPTQKP